MMMNSIDLAWAAGFFDGEGYIVSPKRNHNGYSSNYIRIGINHVDPRPLQKFQQLLGGSLREDKTVYGNRKVRWVWSISCNGAKEVLVKLRPYLINKDIVADIALQFLETISPNKKQLSAEVIQFRQDCAARLKLVNSQS
jgi:hypothetical protein